MFFVQLAIGAFSVAWFGWSRKYRRLAQAGKLSPLDPAVAIELTKQALELPKANFQRLNAVSAIQARVDPRRFEHYARVCAAWGVIALVTLALLIVLT